MKFKQFLFEQKENHAVMAFGRMNPITVGHEKLVNKVRDIAKTVGGSAHVIVSHSQDSKKNPLTAEQKVKHAKRAFPGVNVSSSDSSAPNFLAQAAKLHKQGVTHLHMIGGSDRVDEFHKLLHKYNGVKGPHGHYNFKHIEVHSAGDRDPDAEGVEGMSASKMREHASKGNYKEFRKGVPSKMSDAHAKEMYDDVRKGMSINEDLNLRFEEFLTEGVHDKGIFKAVFLFGGPGSGKDYVLSRTLDGHGLVEINSDKALEFLMDKEKLDKKMPENETEQRNAVRARAKNVTELRQRLALFGRNGLIINGTGDDVEKIAKIKEKLEILGYDTSGIMVNTADEVSKQRNIERGQRGGRTVPEEIRSEKWQSVQNARPGLAKMFGSSYTEFDNSEDLRTAAPEIVQAKDKELMDIFKNVQKFVNKSPTNPNAKSWVASELEKKDTLKVDTKKQIVPHEGSKAAEEARKMGLQYFGFGRYGRNGKVTHRSVHDRLVEVQPQGNVGASMSKSKMAGRTEHKIGNQTIHVKMNESLEDLLNEVVGQGGRDYEETINTRLKKYGKARPDATTAGSSADAPDATFLHKDTEHNLEIKKDKGAMFGQMELHHNGREWDASEKSKKKYPKTYESIKKSGFFNTLNKKWKKPTGDYEKDLEMGNVYHNHPNADPIKAHYGHDRRTNYVQIGGHGFYHTGNDAAGLNSPELHGQTQIRARMKPRGYDANGKRTYGALAVMSLKGDVKKSHHDLDVDPKNVNEQFEQILKEDYGFSDHASMHSLLLGNNIDEHDLDAWIHEKKESKYLTDSNGHIRIFMLRSAAANEAHQKNGTVYPYKNGYVIKINENKEKQDVSIFEKTFQQKSGKTVGLLRETFNGYQSGNSGKTNSESIHLKEETQQVGSDRQTNKITLTEIRKRQKEKVAESIDKGIEPGLSMATSGENLMRPSSVKTKQIKKPLEELTGDETTASIGDQAEDELKKKGISLTSFKKRNFIT